METKWSRSSVVGLGTYRGTDEQSQVWDKGSMRQKRDVLGHSNSPILALQGVNSDAFSSDDAVINSELQPYWCEDNRYRVVIEM